MELLQHDKTGEMIERLQILGDKYNASNNLEHKSYYRARIYVNLFTCFKYKEIYDLNRVFCNISYNKVLRDVYMCILNEKIAQHKQHEEKQKIDMSYVVESLQQLINILKEVL